jgi:hypothetical protein
MIILTRKKLPVPPPPLPNVASTICPNFHWHAIWWYIHKKASSYGKIVGSRLGARTTWKGTQVQIAKLQNDLHAEIVQKYLYTKRTCCTINVKGYAQSHTFWDINLPQKQSTTPSLSVLKSHKFPCLASCNYSSQARQKSLHLLKTWLRYHKCLKSYQYMCNIVNNRVNNSKSSRTYTQEARETPVLNLITLW